MDQGGGGQVVVLDVDRELPSTSIIVYYIRSALHVEQVAVRGWGVGRRGGRGIGIITGNVAGQAAHIEGQAAGEVPRSRGVIRPIVKLSIPGI
jgi:hypothetical protein